MFMDRQIPTSLISTTFHFAKPMFDFIVMNFSSFVLYPEIPEYVTERLDGADKDWFGPCRKQMTSLAYTQLPCISLKEIWISWMLFFIFKSDLTDNIHGIQTAVRLLLTTKCKTIRRIRSSKAFWCILCWTVNGYSNCLEANQDPLVIPTQQKYTNHSGTVQLPCSWYLYCCRWAQIANNGPLLRRKVVDHQFGS